MNDTKARQGRNPKIGETIQIAASQVRNVLPKQGTWRGSMVSQPPFKRQHFLLSSQEIAIFFVLEHQ